MSLAFPLPTHLLAKVCVRPISLSFRRTSRYVINIHKAVARAQSPARAARPRPRPQPDKPAQLNGRHELRVENTVKQTYSSYKLLYDGRLY